MMAVSKILLDKYPNRTQVCDKHGEYISLNLANIWTGCGECSEEKQKLEDQDRAIKLQEEWERKTLERKIGRARIPERFLSRNFDNYVVDSPESEKALKAALNYASTFAENKGASLIFHGKVGTGKTHLAVSIANYLLNTGFQPVFTSVYKAMMKIKESYSRDSEFTEKESIDMFIEPDLLILDEVGVQFNSETEKMYLFEIINGRYENMKSTILISNMNIKELENCIGTRVLDRLREGGGKAVYFGWDSHRKNI